MQATLWPCANIGKRGPQKPCLICRVSTSRACPKPLVNRGQLRHDHGLDPPLVHWLPEARAALALDRNLALANAIIGRGKIFVGRAEETEAHVNEALRLSPRDTVAYIWMTTACVAKNHLGSWEQASWFRRAIEANRNHPLAFFLLAASLAQLGRLGEARSAVQAGLALNPAYRLPRPHRLGGDERRPHVSRPA